MAPTCSAGTRGFEHAIRDGGFAAVFYRKLEVRHVADGQAIIERRKREMRAAQRQLRAEARRLADSHCYSRAAEVFLDALPVPSDGTIAGYWPIGDEFDPRPLLEMLAARGARLALPVVDSASGLLLFREWRPGMALAPAGFGTFGPPPGFSVVAPRIVIAPLLAFDRQGHRLGYGGGFYDRSLAALRADGKCELALGLGFAAQRVRQVPVNEADVRLDGVLTEKEFIWTGKRQDVTQPAAQLLPRQI